MPNRRAFLKGSLAGFWALSLPVEGCQGYRRPTPSLAFFTPTQWATLDAASRRLVPAGPGHLGAGDVGVAAAADSLFARANPSLQGELKKLLDVFEDVSYLNWRLRPFTALDAAGQDAYLKRWENGHVALERQGFVGLNRISAMLFYMDSRAWKQIGFPGPWVGRLDVGLGLDNQGPLAANPNPAIYETVAL